MTPWENFGVSDIIQRLISEGESQCCLKAPQMYLQLAWELMQKGRDERQKALLLDGGVGGGPGRDTRVRTKAEKVQRYALREEEEEACGKVLRSKAKADPARICGASSPPWPELGGGEGGVNIMDGLSSHPFPSEGRYWPEWDGVGRGSPFVHENLTPQRIWSLVIITVQKPEENLECSPILSRKQSLSIAADSGETSSQVFSSEAQAGGHMSQRLQGP